MATKGDEVVVESIVKKSLAPQVKDAEIARLLPKKGEYPVRASVIIHGINNAIANGLRRILLTESSNLAMQIDQDSWKTSDEFLMIDMITDRVRLIPLVQAQVAEGMHFVLDVTNDTDEPMDVLTSQLLFSHQDDKARSAPAIAKKERRARAGEAKGTNAFFETINIVTLHPHRSIHFIADVVLGDGMQNAAFATAFTAISIPLDERPRELIEGVNMSGELPHSSKARVVASSSVSNPHVYQLIFDTVGKGDAGDILKSATMSFIERARSILKAQVIHGQEKQSSGSSAQTTNVGDDIAGLYTIKIQGETRTIGELFARCCLEVFPRIDFVASDLNDLENELTIRVRTMQVPIAEVIQATVNHAIAKLEAIARYL
jgi:DNA-directed RNA polymerase subunit L